jgi:lipid-binding SYLF domain-containing protein
MKGVRHMKRSITLTLALCIALLPALTGCSITPKSPEGQAVLEAQANEAIAVLKEKDPSIQRFFEGSYGYAVLPKVFKGGIWAGGAYGKGIVFENGQKIGYCDMSQATLGFTFGGEYFREIIFFWQKPDLDKFKSEEYTFAAQATAVALKAGAAAKADYKDGTAVFTATDKGLMVDASIGGQKFRFTPTRLTAPAPATTAK